MINTLEFDFGGWRSFIGRAGSNLLFRKEKAGSILTDVVNYLLRTTRGVAVGLILLFL